MTETENVKLFESQLTEINKKIIYFSSGGHITPAICILANHTKKMIKLHKLDQIANCMRLANKLLQEANEAEYKEIRLAFYYLFVRLQSSFAKSEWIIIRKYIPAPLYNACLAQTRGASNGVQNSIVIRSFV